MRYSHTLIFNTLCAVYAVQAVKLSAFAPTTADSKLLRRDLFDTPDEIYTVWKTEYQDCGCPTSTSVGSSATNLPYDVVNVNGDSAVQAGSDQDSVLATTTESPTAVQVSQAQATAGVLDGEVTTTSFLTVKKTSTSTTVLHLPTGNVQIITSAPGRVVEVSNGVTYTITSTLRVTVSLPKVTVTQIYTDAAAGIPTTPVSSIATAMPDNGANVGAVQNTLSSSDLPSITSSADLVPLTSTLIGSASTTQSTTSSTVAILPSFSTAPASSSIGVTSSISTVTEVSTHSIQSSVTSQTLSTSSQTAATVAVTSSSTSNAPIITTGTSSSTATGAAGVGGQQNTIASSFTTLPIVPSPSPVRWSNSTMRISSSSSTRVIVPTPLVNLIPDAGPVLEQVLPTVSATFATVVPTEIPESVVASITTQASTTSETTTQAPTPTDTQTWPSPTSTTTIITTVTRT